MALGKKVRVWTRAEAGRDSMGEPVLSWAPFDASNVLVRPLSAGEMSQGDAASDLRPDGVRVRFRLAFPKDYCGPDLKHARVSLTDAPWLMDPEDWDAALTVSGDPQPEDPCPTLWNIICEVGRTDG